jgi:hypothetical protein
MSNPQIFYGFSLLFAAPEVSHVHLRTLHTMKLVCWTAKRRHSGRVGGAKRPSGRNKDLRAAL